VNSLQGLVQKHTLLASIAKNAEKINGIWPSLHIGFYENFFESLKDNRVTDEELTRAVKHVRDTCKFPTPRISDFIEFIKEDRIGRVDTTSTTESEAEKQALIAERDKEDARKLKEWEKFLDEREAAEEALERERNRDVFAEEEAQALKSKKVR
jgi:hypothetical protein